MSWFGAALLTAFSLGGCEVVPAAEMHAPAAVYSENEILTDAAVYKSKDPDVIVIKTFGISMQPIYREGTIILFKPDKMEDLQAGEVIAYRNSAGQVIVHRLVHLYSGGWLVQGDHNSEPDRELVTPQNLIGVEIAHYFPAGTEGDNNQ